MDDSWNSAPDGPQLVRARPRQTTDLVGLWTGGFLLYFKQVLYTLHSSSPRKGAPCQWEPSGLHTDSSWPQWGKPCFLYFTSYLELKWKGLSSTSSFFFPPLLRCDWCLRLCKFKVCTWQCRLCMCLEGLQCGQFTHPSAQIVTVCARVCLCMCVCGVTL